VKNIAISLRIKKNIEFSKALINIGLLRFKKHNRENQIKYLGRELCEYCCHGLHRKLNSSTYYVHYLTK